MQMLPDFTTLTNQLNAITQAVNNLNNNLTTLFSDTTNGFTVSGILTTESGIVRNVRYIIAAGAVTVATTDDIIVIAKTSGAATTVNLVAAPTKGTTFVIKDGKGDAATHNITITPATGTIDGASTYVSNVNYASVTVVGNGVEWSIL